MLPCFLQQDQIIRVCHTLNNDQEFCRASRFFSKDILLAVDDAECIVKLRDGIVTQIQLNPTFMNPWSFFIKGSAAAWEKFLQRQPPAYFSDLSGLMARRHFDVGGDIEAMFAHFWAVNRMLDIFRECQTGSTIPSGPAAKFDRGGCEAIVGRYLHVDILGIEYRIYFEENGQGIPLLCQHTAASDGRQWRHLLNDEEITRRFRVIVPDIPYHGKSSPPESVEWWKQEYKLTRSFFVECQIAISGALHLTQPVYVGCSIGGRLAINLALEHPDKFRAVVGLESGASKYSMARSLDFHDHPRIGNEMRMATMYGKTAPGNPETYRREVAWIYGQSSPSVSKGDLYYNFIDHGLTEEKAAQIDTSKIPVYLLTGEYDWGNSPIETRALAEHIKGSKFVEMKGLGHFPMTENYEVFRSYLLPVLDEIAAKG
ncbi:MAG: alpha/beta hydrolase [Candidatus Binatia bacterium]